MYVAQIHNKLTRQDERMEDLLTSNVFGLWRYLPADLGLVQFLETARNIEGNLLSLPLDISESTLEFWPWLKEYPDAKGAEPDVLVSLVCSNGEKQLILIEAKYLSGKSSYADDGDTPNDQIAREMYQLRQTARRLSFDSYALLYVTAESAMPYPDILAATIELKQKTGDSSETEIYWTTWRHLPQILEDVSSSVNHGVEKKLLDDLAIILNRLGLTYFRDLAWSGWDMGNAHWQFERPDATFDWTPIMFPAYHFQSSSSAY